jgi:hypothetical protein
MKLNVKLIATGTALAIAAAVFVAPSAYASGGWGWGGADRGADLADSLGITVDELQAAQDKAADARIDAAVEAGRLTEEQADLMRASRALNRSIDREALMAEAMGISADDLAKSKEEGSMPELLQNQEFDRAAFAENMSKAHEAAVAKAVEDGVITQEQADALQESGKSGMGRHGGCMGRMGRTGGAKMFGHHGRYQRGIEGDQTRGFAPRAPRSMFQGTTDL